MAHQFAYLVGVDGGGTGTRIRVETPDGQEVARGSSGPSGLAHGIDKAWLAVAAALAQAFSERGLALPAPADLALGLGLAGVHNPHWAELFQQQNPGYGAIALASDGLTTLLGAHLGQAGAIIAIGTGSIGEVIDAAGQHREVGGWGFPAGDEAGGAWMGLRAINHAQRMLDGRDALNPFGLAIIDHCARKHGISGDYEGRQALFTWLAQAGQTEFAQLAPLIIAHAGQSEIADQILQQAGAEVARIAQAMDPTAQLPLALCGGLADALRGTLPAALLARVIAPRSDAAAGALHLIRRQLQQDDQTKAASYAE